MDSYRAFKTEVADVENTWQLFAPFKYCEEYKQIYLRKIHRIRLACRVLHKFRTYKKPILEVLKLYQMKIYRKNHPKLLPKQ